MKELVEEEEKEGEDESKYWGQKVEVGGKWKENGGGCMNYDSFWSSNPQFFLSIRSSCEVILSLLCEGGEDVPIGFYVFSGGKENRILLDQEREPLTKSSFINEKEVTETITLTASEEDYIIIPCTFEPHYPFSFTLRASSTSPSSSIALMPTTKRRTWYEERNNGEWTKETSGGCQNFSTWVNNPQYFIRLPEKKKLFLSLQQTGGGGENSEVGLYVFSASSALLGGKVGEGSGVLGKSKFRSSFASLEVDISEGREGGGEVIVVPCTFDPLSLGKFELVVASTCKTEVFEIKEGNSGRKGTTATGEWGASSSGGCLNHSSWKKNPQYLLSVKKSTSLKITLSRPIPSGTLDPFSMGLYVLSPSSQPPEKPDIIARGQFVPKSSTCTNVFVVEPSERPYVVIPCSFQPGCLSSFVVSVEGGEEGGVELVVDEEMVSPWVGEA